MMKAISSNNGGFMKIEDLKFITPLDINEAHLNITSAEMYEEAKNFNRHMYLMRCKRWKFLRDFWGITILNVLMIAIGAVSATSSYTSLLFFLTGGRGPWGMATGGNVVVTLAPLALYTVMYVYFILIRRFYNWKMILPMSLVIVPVNYCFIVLMIFNVWLVIAMNKVDSEIKGEVGYPHFVELTLSYIRDEENAEEGDMEKFEDGDKVDDLESERKENPFDKYRTKWNDGEGMLRDNDISSDADNF